MLSCFPFSYSPLKDDDYNHLFIGQEDITTEPKDNCLNSVDTSGQPLSGDKLRDNTAPHSSTNQLSAPTGDNLNTTVPLPRTFRKPDAISVDSCVRNESTPVTNSTNGSSFSSSKSSLLKLGFGRSKGTEHLQQEAIRKSNEANSASIHSQRYIKLPTNSSINRFCDSIQNRKNSEFSNWSPNHITNNLNNKSKSRSKPIFGTTSVSLPKPPHESVGLPSVKSASPSSLLLKSSNKNSPELSPKPPPRPQTSHPGLSSGTSTSIMPRQKSSSVNSSDTLSSAVNDQNSCNLSLSTTRATSLTTSASNTTTCASSLARNSCQSASTSAPLASTSSDWNRSGGFINKPARGWLHPDQQIADSGISYAVRVRDRLFCYL